MANATRTILLRLKSEAKLNSLERANELLEKVQANVKSTTDLFNTIAKAQGKFNFDKIVGEEFKRLGGNLKDLRGNFDSLGKSFKSAVSSMRGEGRTLKTGFTDGVLKGMRQEFALLSADITKLPSGLQSVIPSINRFGQALKSIFSGGLRGGISNAVGQFSLSLGAMAPTLLAVGAAASVAVVGLVGIGAALNTMQIEPIQNAFENLTAEFDTSVSFMEQLQTAADGTITKLELMKTTNLALAGATGTAKTAIGQSLPKFLEIARVQSAATGQSVEHLFNSLVNGIKKSEPRWIDNTGLVLKAGEANQRYADKLGKTVEALTAEEKQLALLEATIEAGNAAIAESGGILETNSLKVQRLNTAWKDLGNDFGTAFQPLLGVVLRFGEALTWLSQEVLGPINAGFRLVNDIILAFVDSVIQGLSPLTESFIAIWDVIKAGFNVIGSVFGVGNLLVSTFQNIGKAVEFVLSPLRVLNLFFGAIANILNHVATRFRDVRSIFAVVGATFIEVVRQAATPLKDFFDETVKLVELVTEVFNKVVDLFFLGAARMIGAWVAGIEKARYQVIKAAADIANAIGDFLIGESPPPKGPLSNIDEGGENVMLAWLDGFTNASIDPIEQVMSNVEASLGEIGSFSLQQIEMRFKELDATVQPFIDRVQILQSSLEELQAPVENALDALDKQQQALLKQFNQGNLAVIESIRNIDAQKQALNEELRAREMIVAEAQTQLALAKSTQAQERALLNIRKNQLEPIQKATVERAKEAKAAKETAKAGSDDVRFEEKAPAGGGIGKLSDDLDLGPELSEELDGLTDFGQDLLQETIDGYFESGGGEFSSLVEAEQARLKEGTAKIGEGVGNLTNRFTEPFENIGNTIVTFFTGIPAKIETLFNNFTFDFTAFTQPFTNLADTIVAFFSNPDFSSLTNAIETVRNAIASVIRLFTGGGDEEESSGRSPNRQPTRRGRQSNVGKKQRANTPDDNVFSQMLASISALSEQISTLLTPITDALTLFSDTVSAGLDIVLSYFLPNGDDSLSLKTQQTINRLTPMIEVLTDAWEGFKDKLQGYLETASNFFETYLVSPVISAFDIVITAINNLFEGATKKLNNYIDQFNAVSERIAAFFRVDPLQIDKLDFQRIATVSERLAGTTAPIQRDYSNNIPEGAGVVNNNSVTVNADVQQTYADNAEVRGDTTTAQAIMESTDELVGRADVMR